MAVKITIAVEKTAKDRDLEIGETLNITAVMKGEFCYFLFLIAFEMLQTTKFDFSSCDWRCEQRLTLTSLVHSNSRRPRKSPEASNDSNSENFKRSYGEERNRDSDRYRSDSNRERETRNRH
jgi:hypothetical protein